MLTSLVYTWSFCNIYICVIWQIDNHWHFGKVWLPVIRTLIFASMLELFMLCESATPYSHVLRGGAGGAISAEALSSRIVDSSVVLVCNRCVQSVMMRCTPLLKRILVIWSIMGPSHPPRNSFNIYKNVCALKSKNLETKNMNFEILKK